MKKTSIEEKYNEINKIVEKLKGDISIEESMNLYIEGKQLISECEKELKDIEERIREIENNEQIN